MNVGDGGGLNRLVLLIGPPGEAYEAIGEVIAAHPDVQAMADVHALTPLAYLGYYDKVYKAPYDHVLAAEAQRLFVAQLPRGEADYVDACRAYGERLYGRALDASGKALFLDATHEHTRILPFLRRILPDARFVLVVRHPLALLAERGGKGALDADALRTYMKRIASFAGQTDATYRRIRYEDFVNDPRAAVEALCTYLGLSTNEAMVREAQNRSSQAGPLHAWAQEFGSDVKLAEGQHLMRGFAPEDVAGYGYTPEDIWLPVETALGRPVVHQQPPVYVQWWRGAVAALARAAKREGVVNRVVRKVKLACDVLLREQ